MFFRGWGDERFLWWWREMVRLLLSGEVCS